MLSEMRPKALIVEDDAPTRALLKTLVETHECDVELAIDGEQALHALSATRFEVILLDIVLPKISGVEVMEHLRQHNPKSLERVIVVSGLDVEEIRKVFPTICQTLSKPVLPARLNQWVSACLMSPVNDADAEIAR